MWVRIARFENASDVDAQVAEVRAEIESGEGAPPGATRGEMLVDRAAGKIAFLLYADSEADIRAADAALDAMSPGPGGGGRVSVDIYEVALDISM